MPDYNHEMSDNQRRVTLIELRTIYIEAVGCDQEPRRRAAEIAMMVLTEPLEFHGDLFRDDEWEHPCLCGECRACL